MTLSGPVLYAGAIWIGPACPGNYEAGRQGSSISGIVLHHTASSLQGAVDTFTKIAGGTSAHFIIDRDGTRYQVVDTADTAFSDGVFSVNLSTISVEHVRLWGNGPGTPGYEPITDAQYASSHELCSILAKDHGFQLSQFTVKPHRFYVADICPGDLDVNRVIQGDTPLLDLNQPADKQLFQMVEDIHGTVGPILTAVTAAKAELDTLAAHPGVVNDPQLLALVQQIRSKFS